MSGEPNPQTDPKTEPEGSNENLEQIDRTELEALRAKAVRADAIDAIAKEAGVDGVETAEGYIEILEEAAYNNMSNEPTKPAEPAAPAKPETPPVTQPDPTPTPAAAMSDEAQKKLDGSHQASVQAYLTAQKTEWMILQRDLPEEKRSQSTHAELLKIIHGPEGQIAASVAQKRFNGNIFAAADYIKTLNDGIPAARAEGAAAANAANAAAASATLDPSGATPPAAVKTAEELAIEENQKRADDIAPDTPMEYATD
jgi:hypothetical protein